MTRRLYFEFFYYHSIPEMLLWGVLLVGAWTLLSILFHRKGWQRAWIWTNRVVLGIVVIFILYWTIGKRNPAENGVSLIPFYSFVVAQTSSERYRSVVANVLLFIPVGLSMPFSLCRSHRVSTGREAQVSRSQPLNDSTAQCEQGTDINGALETGSIGEVETSSWYTRHPVRTTILFAVVLSFLIEVLQLVFGLGLCETDDVIANTAGAAFGSISFVSFFSLFSITRMISEMREQGE